MCTWSHSNPRTRAAPTKARWLIWLLAALCQGSALPAAESNAPTGARSLSLEELFGDPVIARGEHLEIRQSQLDRAFLAYRSNLAGRGQRIPDDQRELKEALLLDRMIVTHLLTNRATRLDQEAAVGMAERFYTDTKKASGSDDSFVRQLKLTGLTPEQFNQRLLEQALAESVLDRELKSKITVLPSEIQEFYEAGRDERVRFIDREIARGRATPEPREEEIQALRERSQEIQKANLARLEKPETVQVTHVLISTRVPDTDKPLPENARWEKRREAEAILLRARSGEDFAQLVQKHSQDRRLPESGGVYTFSREDPYAPEFKAASFSLEPGQISDLVTTVFGYHIIKLLKKTPAQKRPLSEVEKSIQNFLQQQKLQEEMPVYFQRLKKEAGVTILEEKYQRALPPEYSSFISGQEELP